MYKKEIVSHEYVYSEEEQKRLEQLTKQLNALIEQGTYGMGVLVKIVDEMESILSGEWSPPMPF